MMAVQILNKARSQHLLSLLSVFFPLLGFPLLLLLFHRAIWRASEKANCQKNFRSEKHHFFCDRTSDKSSNTLLNGVVIHGVLYGWAYIRVDNSIIIMSLYQSVTNRTHSDSRPGASLITRKTKKLAKKAK
jgi:hypothetical protein